MGAEGSVTLQLREAVQAPGVSESGATINNSLTIGYPDPEILADVLGTFQAAGTDTTFDIVDNGNGHHHNHHHHRSSQSLANAFFKASGLTTTTVHKADAGRFDCRCRHPQQQRRKPLFHYHEILKSIISHHHHNSICISFSLSLPYRSLSLT